MIDGGGNNIVHHAHDTGNGFNYTGRAQAMAGHGFGGTDICFIGMFAKNIHDGFYFRNISKRCGSSMCIDIIDICSRDIRWHRAGSIHYILGTPAFRMRRSDMMCIPGGSGTGYFTINPGTPGFGMFQFFQNQRSGTFSHYKSITSLIVRTAGSFRTVISFTQCFHGIKSANTGFTDHTFGSTGQNDIRLTQPDQVKRFHHGIG